MDNLNVGCIIAWTRETIPTNWHICDGTSGTVDLRDKFIKGASADIDVGTTGGATTHNHTYSSYTQFAGAHQHNASVSLAAALGTEVKVAVQAVGTEVAEADHTHSENINLQEESDHRHSFEALLAADNAPPSITLIFIEKIA